MPVIFFEDETMKNETQQFVVQEYKELHGKMFLLSIDQNAMKYIKCKPQFPACWYSQI